MGRRPPGRRRTPGWQILLAGLVDLLLAAALIGVLASPGRRAAGGGEARGDGDQSGAETPRETGARPGPAGEGATAAGEGAPDTRDPAVADAEEAVADAEDPAAGDAEEPAAGAEEPATGAEEPAAAEEPVADAEDPAAAEEPAAGDADGGPPADATTITVYSKPWADFYVDGAHVTTGNVLKEHPVSAGTHQVRLVCTPLDGVEKVFSVEATGGTVNLGCWDFESMAPCS